MGMVRPWVWIWCFAGIFCPTIATAAVAGNSTQDQTPSASSSSHSLSEVLQVISAAHDWNVEEVKVSSVDARNAKFGKIGTYELDLQAGEHVFSARFTDEITSWKYLEEKTGSSAGHEEADEGLFDSANLAAAVLRPFTLEGPLEIWIEDSDHLQLIMPDDTNIGGFKHLVLAEGSVVTVEGAREVSLEQPVDFPLVLNTSVPVSGLGTNLRALLLSLRYASQLGGKNSLALRIVGPTMMVVTSSQNQETTESNIDVKFFGPDTVQIFINGFERSPPSLHEQEFWPLPFLNTSDSKVLFLEKLLITFLGNRAYREGSFRILKASVSALTFVQIHLELEKKLSNQSFNSDLWPAWRTRPTVQRLSFQVLARVEGKKLKPLVIKRLKPFIKVATHSWNDLMSNVTFTSLPSILIPSSPLTLDVEW